MPGAPKLVADVLLTAQGRVLLVRYADVSKYDGEVGWFLPDDYLLHGEHPSDAARRILKDQVGLSTGDVALGEIESFGAEQGGQWHLVFHHTCTLTSVPAIEALGNTRAAEWFPLGKLPAPDTVAHHGWALDVINKLIPGAAPRSTDG